MQEGTPAFVQMVRISAAVAAHRTAGLPYLVYLRHPTTGGVMASWGSLGPRHRRRARRPGRLPRPPGLRGALRPALPRGRADLGEPLRPRHHRRRPAARGDQGDPRPRAQHPAWPPGTASPRSPDPGQERRAGRRRVGLRDPVAAPGPARRTTAAALRRQRRRTPQRDRAGRARPRAADRAGALRRGAVRLPRPGPPRPDHRPPDGTRGAARGPARDAAGLRARAAAGDRHRHPGRRPLRGRRERRPGRRDRPLAWPTSSPSTRPRCA